MKYRYTRELALQHDRRHPYEKVAGALRAFGLSAEAAVPKLTRMSVIFARMQRGLPIGGTSQVVASQRRRRHR